MPDVTDQVLDPESDALVDDEDQSTTATEDEETTTAEQDSPPSKPERKTVRYKDLLEQREREHKDELAKLRAEIAERDAASESRLQAMAQRQNDLILRTSQTTLDRELKTIEREVIAEMRDLIANGEMSDHYAQQWANRELNARRKEAEAEAKLARANDLANAASEAEKRTSALTARPKQLAGMIAQSIREKLDAHTRLKPEDVVLGVEEVIGALKLEPWREGAMEEAERVINRLLDKQVAAFYGQTASRREALAERAKAGTDTMPGATGGATMGWREAMTRRANGQLTQSEFERIMRRDAPREKQEALGLV